VNFSFFLFLLVLISGMIFSIVRQKLTIAASITGGLLGLLLYAGLDWNGFILMVSFFVAGTLATSWKRKQKELLKVAEANKGKRKWTQVLANGGVGGLLGGIALFFPGSVPLLTLLVAGAFSSAAADTLSSELGSLYGRRFYHVLSFKKDKRGLDGVISPEGTIIGIAGSVFIAVIYSLYAGWGIHFLWIAIGGTTGNFSDSVLGAWLERKGLIKNDVVNFINTMVGAIVPLSLHLLCKG
jgi:uncharacterized protein (TIGR00297 family)